MVRENKSLHKELSKRITNTSYSNLNDFTNNIFISNFKSPVELQRQGTVVTLPITSYIHIRDAMIQVFKC